ncbi:MAG: (E)-4-hydroxy-3-methylbut-2-enyl-diphosphate synthase [Bacteroidia bacterium]|jgi:(E)-4-hydroxy-3-methylbut-2-enyl-diphosphate synthase|nr:(E)-4-hydroxy-3-methylbut-2-enyl-diphosphate synthase [Bacteroidia bacterium]
MNAYIPDFTKYQRRKTRTVQIGDLYMGSDFPIRVQSMTTTDTLDTAASVAQIKRMVAAGCELVRLTAPSMKEAENLAVIKKELQQQGINVPLVADIHFTPNAAEIAARIVEKVRINPGNYVDKKKFELIEYSDADYAEELDRIRTRFTPLVRICKEYGTAMRIGTNHGSLSDRIMSRYGDTAHGMVESAMEFLRIAEDEGFHNIVLSMKSSNPQVMVEAYRLLVHTMNQHNMLYPLHLGVTEAGDGDDGRIKSALGIGSLLEDGIGDTIRVSLTEDPEFEVPVAQQLVARYTNRPTHLPIAQPIPQAEAVQLWNPFTYQKRETQEVGSLGGGNVPRVIANYSMVDSLTPEQLTEVGHVYDARLDKWHMTDLGCDFIYRGSHHTSFMLPNGVKGLYDAEIWNTLTDKLNNFPVFTLEAYLQSPVASQTLNMVKVQTSELTSQTIHALISKNNTVLWLDTASEHAVADLRNAFLQLKKAKCTLPVVVTRSYNTANTETAMLHASTDIGSLLTDGFGDGLMLTAPMVSNNRLNAIAFGILQAARARITKTEYISCPSCGRTLFDLQETTALIRKHTDHLKGVKIAIMGCIVNGPGEMADADYGYVGSGPGKITLYKGKEVVKKGVNKETAVQELIGIIREDGRWIEVGEATS